MVGGAAAEPVGAVRDDRAAVAVAGLLSFVAMFDMNVVTVALPRIADGFGADPRAVQWVVLAYAIPAVALLLPAGRWLDRVAARPALLLAVAVFAAANLAAVVAPSLPVLVGLRALQGVGGAVLMVLMPVLAMAAVAPQRRGRAMAVPATAGPVGGVLGPAVGGPLIELAGWRVAFVPAVLVSLAAVVLVRRSRIVAGVLAGPDRAGLVDAALLVAGLGVVCAVATGLLTGPAAVTVAVVAGVAALVAWGARPGARSVAAALRPGGTAPTVAVALLAGAFAAASYLVAVGLQAGGSGPAAAGFVLLAFPLGMVVAGPPAGRLADRFSPRAVAVAGVALAAVGFALLAALPDGEWTPIDVAWRVALAGLGTGLYGGPTQVLVLAGAARERMATAGAGVQCARALGFAVGPAAAALAWNTEGTVLATRPALIVAAVTAVVAALLLIGHRGRPTTEENT
ncbi:MFS transporter [Pseudonocardia alni]|jgi:DHA2 family multidrug resistance protein-like MFS transporter|uniref:MFS transporter n=1 Tax=Pseudonocardia alni TaxID=33907 RepID=UPI0033E23A7F